MRTKKWIQKIKFKKGWTHNYLKKKYGNKAFNKDGTIKMEYLDRAIKNAKNITIKRRLILAKTLKQLH